MEFIEAVFANNFFMTAILLIAVMILFAFLLEKKWAYSGLFAKLPKKTAKIVGVVTTLFIIACILYYLIFS